LAGDISAATAERWAAGVRVRPENCIEYGAGSEVMFLMADAMTNPCGEFKFNLTELASQNSDSD